MTANISLQAQNVSINSTGAAAHPSAQLDVQSTNKGVLLPQVALLDFFSPAPITAPAAGLLVYNTNTIGNVGQGITPGYYFWTGNQWQRLSSEVAWLNGGNALNAPGVFGSATNNPIDILMNSAIRGRLTSAGEFHCGATATAIVGDLMTATANASFPFALNGYSSFNGAGVYGAVQGGTTQFAGVQGEYFGTANLNTAGVRGQNLSSTAGTGFRTLAVTGPRVGVIGGTTFSSGQYTFGVHGSMNSTDIRCGGVFGDDFGIASGALAYYAANLNDYSVYGFGRAFEAGTVGGRLANQRPWPNPIHILV